MEEGAHRSTKREIANHPGGNLKIAGYMVLTTRRGWRRENILFKGQAAILRMQDLAFSCCGKRKGARSLEGC